MLMSLDLSMILSRHPHGKSSKTGREKIWIYTASHHHDLKSWSTEVLIVSIYLDLSRVYEPPINNTITASGPDLVGVYSCCIPIRCTELSEKTCSEARLSRNSKCRYWCGIHRPQ